MWECPLRLTPYDFSGNYQADCDNYGAGNKANGYDDGS